MNPIYLRLLMQTLLTNFIFSKNKTLNWILNLMNSKKLLPILYFSIHFLVSHTCIIKLRLNFFCLLFRLLLSFSFCLFRSRWWSCKNRLTFNHQQINFFVNVYDCCAWVNKLWFLINFLFELLHIISTNFNFTNHRVSLFIR